MTRMAPPFGFGTQKMALAIIHVNNGLRITVHTTHRNSTANFIVGSDRQRDRVPVTKVRPTNDEFYKILDNDGAKRLYHSTFSVRRSNRSIISLNR